MARVRTRKFAAVVTALGAGTAGATVVDRGDYTSEPYSFSHEDCGLPIDVKGTSSGHFRIRAGKGKTGPRSTS